MKTRIFAATLVLALCAIASVACGPTDPGITAKVKTKLAADDTVKASEIDVDTRNRVVTLTGTVDNPAAKDRALQIAKQTENVAEVVDMIAVRTSAATGDAPEPDRTVGDRIDDAGITVRVKGRLLEDPLVKGLKIDVDTREGVVYLTGTVATAAEKEKAIELARGAEGVRDVQADLNISR